MQRITLPSGATADIRNVADVTERHRRPLRRAQGELGKHAEFFEVMEKAQEKLQANKKLTKAEQDAFAADLGPALDLVDKLNDLVVVAMVAGWSHELPVDLEGILDIPGADLDALREAVAPLSRGLLPDFSPAKDKASPTGV